MGIIACYMESDISIVNELKKLSGEDCFEYVDELEESETLELFDMDKMWDALHFFMTTDVSISSREKDLLSKSIYGSCIIEDDMGILSYITLEELSLIVKELDDFDVQKTLENFDPKILEQQEIYPDIWLTEDKEELKNEIIAAYFGLKEFYHHMVTKKKMVVISIYG